MTTLRKTPARLRAMREAVSERGYVPRGKTASALWQQFMMALRLDEAGLLKSMPVPMVATPAGRAWLKAEVPI